MDIGSLVYQSTSLQVCVSELMDMKGFKLIKSTSYFNCWGSSLILVVIGSEGNRSNLSEIKTNFCDTNTLMTKLETHTTTLEFHIP